MRRILKTEMNISATTYNALFQYDSMLNRDVTIGVLQ